MTITVHVQPGETIGQALIRAQLIARETEPITILAQFPVTIPPGVQIIGSNLRQTGIVEHRTTGIPFLNYNGDQP